MGFGVWGLEFGVYRVYVLVFGFKVSGSGSFVVQRIAVRFEEAKP